MPESTIKGNKDGIICLDHVVSPVFTKDILLTELVKSRNINNNAVIKGRYLLYKSDVFAELFILTH